MNLFFALSCMMAVMWWMFCGNCDAAAEFASNSHRRLRTRPLLRGYSMENLAGDDEDFVDLSKRQHFDDYGHMRFGKREQFDDYGHLRFGRSYK